MSESINVTCPSCQNHFPLSQGILSSVREGLSRELQGGITERERVLEAEKEAFRLEQAALKVQRSEMQEAVDAQVEQRLAKEITSIRSKAEEKAVKKAAEDQALQLKALEQERDEKDAALKQSREEHLAVLAEKRKLAEEKDSLELENQRKLDQERDKIRDQAQKRADEDNRLKLAEKEKTIAEMQVKLEEAQRKGAQGSIQRQGEVFEQDFEQQLRQTFPIDQITPVSVGARGADIAQEVMCRTGRSCGKLLFENKRTKAWHDDWIAKLKGDMRSAQADIGIIVTETLPKDIDSFGLKDGIWVSDFASAIPLAHVLRMSLHEVMIAKGHREGAKEKMELLYDYLTGNEFRQRVQMVIESFHSLRSELDKERSYMTTKWNKREKQINLVIENMSGMVGDVQGLSGGAIQSLPMLEDEDDPDSASGDNSLSAEDAA